MKPAHQAAQPLAEPAEMLDETASKGAQRLAAEGAGHASAAGFEAEPLAVPVEHGTWRTLLRVARDRHARLVVVGSHGMSPLDVALGTVPTASRPMRTARSSWCPAAPEPPPTGLDDAEGAHMMGPMHLKLPQPPRGVIGDCPDARPWRSVDPRTRRS